MSNPEIIALALDRHLRKPTRLILYGRAAIGLGYANTPSEIYSTFDVDVILPQLEIETIEHDDQFWDALEQTNAELEPTGLYLTHLFVDDQVILTPDWLNHLVPIRLPNLANLQLARPSTGDLILTKMMRVDPQDRDDIKFLLSELDHLDRFRCDFLERARLPDIEEIQSAFRENWNWINKYLPVLQ